MLTEEICVRLYSDKLCDLVWASCTVTMVRLEMMHTVRLGPLYPLQFTGNYCQFSFLKLWNGPSKGNGIHPLPLPYYSMQEQ